MRVEKAISVFSFLYCILLVHTARAELCARANSTTHRLHNYLFNQGYNASIVPIDSNEPIEVVISYVIFAEKEVNEKQQTMELLGFLFLRWYDQLLYWNETEFDPETTTVVSADMVWIPPLVLIESTTYEPMETNGEIVIEYDGFVRYHPHSIIQMKCEFDLTYFPFDTHLCRFHFELWSNTVDEVYLQPAKLLFRSENKSNIHSEWELIPHAVENYTKNYDGFVFSGCQFSITLKRRPLLQIFNTILPLIILSLLNLTIFRLPVERNGRVSLGTTMLLAFSVWQLMLNDIMPSGTDKISILGIYILIFEVISSIGLCASVMVIRMNKRPLGQHVPKWFARATVFCTKINLAQCLGRNRQQQATKNTDVSWTTVAHVVDDICFYLFLGMIVFSTASMLLFLLLQ